MLAGALFYFVIRGGNMPSEEIAAMGFLTAKEGREEDCYRLARSLTESTHANDKGCIYYAFFRRTDDSSEFILHERWENKTALIAHFKRLVAAYGPAAPGVSLPEGIAEPFERIQFVGLTVVE